MPSLVGAPAGTWQAGANDLAVSDQFANVSVPVLSPVHCFVEVRFRGQSRRTITTHSQFPIFNEQVRRTISPPTPSSPSSTSR